MRKFFIITAAALLFSCATSKPVPPSDSNMGILAVSGLKIIAYSLLTEEKVIDSTIEYELFLQNTYSYSTIQIKPYSSGFNFFYNIPSGNYKIVKIIRTYEKKKVKVEMDGLTGYTVPEKNITIIDDPEIHNFTELKIQPNTLSFIGRINVNFINPAGDSPNVGLVHNIPDDGMENELNRQIQKLGIPEIWPGIKIYINRGN